MCVQDDLRSACQNNFACLCIDCPAMAKPDINTAIPPTIEGWPVPTWVGPGLTSKPAHLEIHKEGALFDTYDFKGRPMISVGRAADRVTFCLDHPSISRLHAIFLHHRHLEARLRLSIVEL